MNPYFQSFFLPFLTRIKQCQCINSFRRHQNYFLKCKKKMQRMLSNCTQIHEKIEYVFGMYS